MTITDDGGRPQTPMAADEKETLLGFLEFHRATFAWKCAGLDAVALRAKLVPSTTLGGMMKHLALVENGWFSQILFGREPAPPWDEGAFEADPDWEWHSAADDSTEQLFSWWEEAVARSRVAVGEALAKGGLDQLALRPSSWSGGRAPSLRWIIAHMIEEYARHNGHADLIRESIDGATGV